MRTIGLLVAFLMATNAASGQLPTSAATLAPAPPLTTLKATDAGGDVKARRERVASLIAEGRSATSKAIQLLESPAAEDRAAGIFVLASVRAVETAPTISRVITNDKADGVRLQAAEALGSLGSPEGIAALVRAANSDANRNVRVRAITSLGRIDSSEVISPIRHVLESPRSDPEFEAAAVAAGRRRIAEVEPDLIKVCADTGRSEHVRSAAVTALGLMASPDALGTIVHLTRDPSPVVRFNAIGAIDEMLDTSSAVDVVSILTNATEEKFVRVRAASALARMGTRQSISALRTMAEGADEFMAMHSVVALLQADAAQARSLATTLRARAKDPFVVQIADRVVRGQALQWGQR